MAEVQFKNASEHFKATTYIILFRTGNKWPSAKTSPAQRNDLGARDIADI